ncbi:MFS transporter [Aliiglaciecola sp. 3_MG-2023]|uniref:MFS transporter n=1 Tax=Aliiglaciecola TaxID=1406885 RepID=UPI001C09B5C3|nr:MULTISPECIES: MFS transporter [Aliiglaciecola]MBU2878971.1 MFS transporter [Aliiglaciecola lipolytica]MDO6693138.1 MFS transporter [Aliiglaciecola sp. 3_MG-2023]MDO6710672.1 MFS transporter [Aliiglaciecola sp. 2_MG-2023]MDO6751920.1 MFS transporter [Aliiglaciecola sp. 1_MG-2023]
MQKNPDSLVTQYSLIAAFGGFIFGLDAANISGAIRFVSSLFELDSIQQGTVVGCALLGVIVALLFTGTLCDKYGRYRVLLGIGFTYSLSSLISATAVNYEMLVVGRFIGGVAFASITVSAMYIGEIAPAKKRGKFVSVNQFMIGLGLLVAFVVNYFLLSAMDDISWINKDNVWRVMLGAELIANAVWVTLLFRVPESPRWLIKQGRDTEARTVFSKIALPEKIEQLINEIKHSLKEDVKLNTQGQLKLLFSPRLRFVLLIAVCYAIVQGATGMNAVLFFAPMVFEQIGMSVEDTFMQTITIGVVGLVATLIAIGFVEKLGRRILTVAGLLLVVVAHGSTWFGFSQANYVFDETAVGSITSQLQQQGIETDKIEQLHGETFANDVALKSKLAELFNNKDLPMVSGIIIKATIKGVNAPLVLFGIFAFLAAFNLSIGPIMWVIFSEVFPNAVRSVALPFAALVQTISSWSIQQFFPWQLNNMGVANIFMLYAVIGFIGLIIMYFFLPETKGKTIEEIERELAKV